MSNQEFEDKIPSQAEVKRLPSRDVVNYAIWSLEQIQNDLTGHDGELVTKVIGEVKQFMGGGDLPDRPIPQETVQDTASQFAVRAASYVRASAADAVFRERAESNKMESGFRNGSRRPASREFTDSCASNGYWANRMVFNALLHTEEHRAEEFARSSRERLTSGK